MVYHRSSLSVGYIALLALATGRLLRSSFDEVLNHYSDGYLARFYTCRRFANLLRPRFAHVETQVFGKCTEVFPLPGHGVLGVLKRRLTDATPDWLVRTILTRWGLFLFAVARK